MSLLIKALHKAEQSKNEVAQNTAASTSPADVSSLELAPHDDAVSSLRDEIGFEPSPSPAPMQAQRQAASAVFLAGQRGVAGSAQAPRTLWLAGIGLLFLLLLGGGFYYYLDSLEQPELIVARPAPLPPTPMTAPPAPIETPAPVTADEARVDAPPATASAETTREEKPAAERVPPVQPEETVAVAKVEEKPKLRPGTAPAPRVVRNRPPAMVISDDVAAGYRAYTSGDDTAASRHYLAAAQADPRNVDAWLGLAAVAARQGSSSEAASHYLRALELEPRNAAAQTGLISLSGQSDPMAGESRLKNLLAQQPEAAFLHAALGSLYADQGQWTAAQQAYFQAFRFDAGNPEHAFNLAVSLDQMGKAELALTHYQKALDLLAMHGGRLDRPQLEARIAQLRQSLSPSQ